MTQILIIDDEQSICWGLSQLCKQMGFDSMVASSVEGGMELIAEIVEIYSAYPEIETEILVASVRHIGHVVQAAKLGADVATLPPSVLRAMYRHPLTDKGLEAFLADWAKTGQSIINEETESSDVEPKRRSA